LRLSRISTELEEELKPDEDSGEHADAQRREERAENRPPRKRMSGDVPEAADSDLDEQDEHGLLLYRTMVVGSSSRLSTGPLRCCKEHKSRRNTCKKIPESY